MTAPQIFTSAADRKVVDLRSDIGDVKLKEITAGIGHAHANAVDSVCAGLDNAIKVRDDSAFLPLDAHASPVHHRPKRVPEKGGGRVLRKLANERTPSFGSRQPPPKKTHPPLIPMVYPPTRGHAKDRVPSRAQTKEGPPRTQRKELAVTDESARMVVPVYESPVKNPSPPTQIPTRLSAEELLANCSVDHGAAHVEDDGAHNSIADRPQTEYRQGTSKRQGSARERKKTLSSAKRVYGECIDLRKLNKRIKIMEVDYKHYQKVLRRSSPRYQDGMQRRLDEATDALNEEERRARKLFSLTQTLTNKDQRAEPASPTRERAEIQRLESQIVNFEERSARCLERKVEINIKFEDVQQKIEKLSASVVECTGWQQKQLADRRAKEKLMEVTRRTREQELTEEVEEVMAKRHLLQRRFSQSIQSQQFVLQGLEDRLKCSVEKKKRLDAQLEQWRKREGDHVIEILDDSLCPKRVTGSPPASRSKSPTHNSPTKPHACAATSTSVHSGDNGGISATVQEEKPESLGVYTTPAAQDRGPQGSSTNVEELVDESRRTIESNDGVVVVETSGMNITDAAEAKTGTTTPMGKTSTTPHQQQLPVTAGGKKMDETGSSVNDEDFDSCTPSVASAAANATMSQQLFSTPAPIVEEGENYSEGGDFEAESVSPEDNVNGQSAGGLLSELMPESSTLPDSKKEVLEMSPPAPQEEEEDVRPLVITEQDKSVADALLLREKPVQVVAPPSEVEDATDVIARDNVEEDRDKLQETAPQPKKLGRPRPKEESAKDDDELDIDLLLSKK